MPDNLTTVGGVPIRLPLAALRLDWRNPRLPPFMQRSDVSQDELALYIDIRYNPLEVATSIARHGFFESEPLIAVKDGDSYVVVEGNRRLTALLGLANPELRVKLEKQTRAWGRVKLQHPLPDLFPVVVVEERTKITPLLGFRHISGIKEWEAFAQARYIADLVEEEGYSLDEVADLVGRPPLEVKAMYRDHEIVRQGDEYFHLDTTRVTQDFGVFNAAMSIRNIRTYLGAPTPANVRVDYWPLDDDKAGALERLLVYIYGDARGRGKVVPESRKLSDLGRVLADPSGRAERVLRDGGELNDAMESLTDPVELVIKRLAQALNSLVRVNDEFQHGDSVSLEAESLLTRLQNVLDELDSKISAGRGSGRGSRS